MLLYVGKLDWKPYGDNELLVVIIPKDHVEQDDPIYIFSQWTKDAHSNAKENWFAKQTVDKILSHDSDNTAVSTEGDYYSWEFRWSRARQKLATTMMNPQGSKSKMHLDCVWRSSGDEPGDRLRVWTGKITWPQYASNELFLAVTPHGVGEGKPALALWQWTVNAHNKRKVPCVLKAKQTSGSEDGHNFMFTDHYTMTCIWSSSNQTLAVHMQEPNKHGQDIGTFELSATWTPITQYGPKSSDSAVAHDLQAENSELRQRVEKLTDELAAAHERLVDAQEKLSQSQRVCDNKDRLIQELMVDLEAARAEHSISAQPSITDVYPYEHASPTPLNETLGLDGYYNWHQMSGRIESLLSEAEPLTL